MSYCPPPEGKRRAPERVGEEPVARCVAGRKIRYDTVAETQRAFEEAKRTWRVPPVRWYLCPKCLGYHLTSEPAPGTSSVPTRAKAEYDRRSRPFAALDDLLGET